MALSSGQNGFALKVVEIALSLGLMKKNNDLPCYILNSMVEDSHVSFASVKLEYRKPDILYLLYRPRARFLIGTNAQTPEQVSFELIIRERKGQCGRHRETYSPIDSRQNRRSFSLEN